MKKKRQRRRSKVVIQNIKAAHTRRINSRRLKEGLQKIRNASSFYLAGIPNPLTQHLTMEFSWRDKEVKLTCQTEAAIQDLVEIEHLINQQFKVRCHLHLSDEKGGKLTWVDFPNAAVIALTQKEYITASRALLDRYDVVLVNGRLMENHLKPTPKAGSTPTKRYVFFFRELGLNPESNNLDQWVKANAIWDRQNNRWVKNVVSGLLSPPPTEDQIAEEVEAYLKEKARKEMIAREAEQDGVVIHRYEAERGDVTLRCPFCHDTTHFRDVALPFKGGKCEGCGNKIGIPVPGIPANRSNLARSRQAEDAQGDEHEDQ